MTQPLTQLSAQTIDTGCSTIESTTCFIYEGVGRSVSTAPTHRTTCYGRSDVGRGTDAIAQGYVWGTT